MHPSDVTDGTFSSNTGQGGVLRLPTTRKRSKSYLTLSPEASISEAGTSEAFRDSNLTPSLSSTTARTSQSATVLTFSMLQGEGSNTRLRTPTVPVSTLTSNGPVRMQNNWASRLRIGSVYLDDALDWSLVVVAIIVLAGLEAAKPREAYIPKALLSTSTNFPHTPNSVPAWSVPVYTLILPAAAFVLHSVVLRRPLAEANVLVLGVVHSVLLTAVLTNMIKCPVGRLRPDFNARCWPDGKIQWTQSDEWGGYANCTGKPGDVAEGRKSFPSGHSSWSAAGLCYLTWFLIDRMQVFDGSGHPWRLLTAALPALAAVSVGITRYTDYWHHPTDIIAGLLLGTVISWLFYRQQRLKLAELDSASYSGALGSGYRSYTSSGAATRLDEDGLPLLGQQGLPV